MSSHQCLTVQEALKVPVLLALSGTRECGLCQVSWGNHQQDLSWNSHIENITVHANRTLGFVKRNIKTKKQEIQTIAYNTLVRPQVEYASAVWSPYMKENINRIEMLQRRAARWVCNDYSPYSSVTDMLSNLGWRSLELRRYDSCIATFYKIVYGLVAIPVPPYFEHTMIQTHHHPLVYRQIHTSFSYYYYSFFPLMVILWNRLPADLVLDSDLDSFKQGVSKINHTYTVFILLLNSSS